MSQLELLVEKRDAIRAAFERFGVTSYKLYATGGNVGFTLQFARDHFESLDGLGKALQKLGLRFRKHANGYERIPYLSRRMSQAMGVELVIGIIERFKRYFDFWMIVDEKTGAPRMVRDDERPALERGLTYRSIVAGTYEVVVDGLVSRAPECTVENAMADLFANGSNEELRALAAIIERADRGPRKVAAREMQQLDDAVRVLSRKRWIVSMVRSKKSSPFSSHVHGVPYFEAGEAWPIDPKLKRPLELVLQIVAPRGVLPDGIGVLQLYYDSAALPHDTKDAGWLVKTYAKVDRRRARVIAPPDGLKRGRCSAITLIEDGSLPEWPELDEWGRAGRAVRARCERLDAYVSEEVYRRARKRLVARPNEWSFIGGYPRGLQSLPGTSSRREWAFVLQLGSDDRRDLMWGDAG